MKERTKGFISGILVAALTVALSVGVFAAAQTITVNGGIKIQIDGQPFTPTDANGAAVDVFESNGTTYLPVRAIAGIAGYDVEWDGATRTVKLTSGASENTDKPASVSDTVLIDKQGIKIAYTGVSINQAGWVDVNLTIENSNSETYIVQARNVSMNGIMCDPIFSCQVAAEKKALDAIHFLLTDKEKLNITTADDVEEVELYFIVFNQDFDTLFESEVITIKN